VHGRSRGLAGIALRSLLPLGLVATALISTEPAGAAIRQHLANSYDTPTCSSSASITFGAPPSSGSISDPTGPPVCFTFDADASDTVVVHAISTSGSGQPTVTLVDPNGNVVNPNEFGGDYSLQTTGTYTLEVTATAAGSFNVYVQRTDNPVGCTTVTLASPAFVASIADPGQVLCFQYEVIYPEMVVAHIQTAPALLTVQDFYPDGAFSGGEGASAPATVGAPGNVPGYPTMLIFAASPATGSIGMAFASLELSRWSGKPGTTEKLVAEHLPKRETITFSYMTGLSDPTSQVICKAYLANSSQVSCTGYIPAKKDAGAPGYHLIVASAPNSSHVAEADFLLK
jgi:hypothetical protein